MLSKDFAGAFTQLFFVQHKHTKEDSKSLTLVNIIMINRIPRHDLHDACEYGDIQAVEKILSGGGVNINGREVSIILH